MLIELKSIRPTTGYSCCALRSPSVQTVGPSPSAGNKDSSSPRRVHCQTRSASLLFLLIYVFDWCTCWKHYRWD